MNFGKELNNGKNIFVFGSNTTGRHGKGAALQAKHYWGAKYGVGEGRTGMAYGIPTKNGETREMKVLSLSRINRSVTVFIEYARCHPELTFLVTKIGCGLAGYEDCNIMPMFIGAPDNCVLPHRWRIPHAHEKPFPKKTWEQVIKSSGIRH